MQRSEREALIEGLTEIDYLVNTLNLSSATKQRSTEIYRKAATADNILVGRGIDKIASGCVLLATRDTTDVITAEDVENASKNPDLTATILHRITKDLRNELDLGFMLADPHKYVEKLHEELNLHDDLAALTHESVDLVTENGLTSGKKAGTIAGATFYALTRLVKDNNNFHTYTQADVCEVVEVTEVSIRNSYREYMKFIHENQDQLTRSL